MHLASSALFKYMNFKASLFAPVKHPYCVSVPSDDHDNGILLALPLELGFQPIHVCLHLLMCEVIDFTLYVDMFVYFHSTIGPMALVLYNTV